ncbi:MAG: TlpA family protein disulfide reductase [Sulfuritalea sp.]|nr:TlpA family protein disulfide reductase [Sulfuritalea sp.]
MLSRLLALLVAAGVAHAAPLDFELSDGRRFVRLSELPPRVTVVNFWRSDCPPCLREMPLLGEFARRDRARVVAVALQRPAETLAAPRAVREALLPPVLALNGPSELRGLLSRFGNPVGALPYTVALDARRVPCMSRAGEIDAAWLDRALQACATDGREQNATR